MFVRTCMHQNVEYASCPKSGKSTISCSKHHPPAVMKYIDMVEQACTDLSTRGGFVSRVQIKSYLAKNHGYVDSTTQRNALKKALGSLEKKGDSFRISKAMREAKKTKLKESLTKLKAATKKAADKAKATEKNIALKAKAAAKKALLKEKSDAKRAKAQAKKEAAKKKALAKKTAKAKKATAKAKVPTKKLAATKKQSKAKTVKKATKTAPTKKTSAKKPAKSTASKK